MTTKIITHLIVSCEHANPSYRLDNAEVQVRYDSLDGTYFWSRSPFGCSKSYATAKDAVRGMLSDHACFNIRVTELIR